MNEMDKLCFNHSTLSRKINSMEIDNIVACRADVKNDYGWNNFVFIHGRYDKEDKHSIQVVFEDDKKRVYQSNVFPDHPDYEFLETYILNS